MAGGSNPQNVQAPQQGGMGQRRGPSIEGQPSRNPTFGFNGYRTPQEAEAAARAGGPSASEGRFYSLPPGWQGVREGAPDARMSGAGGAPATAPSTGQPNVFQQSSNAYAQALQGTTAAGGMPNISAFQNPYTQQVIDTSMADLERQRLMQQNQLGQQASAARAFGGSRQGIAEAETNRAFAEQGGQLAAQLRQQGFNTALGAAQNQQGQQLAAAGQLGNLSQQGFNMGQSINQQQQQFGTMQQAINQALIDAARGQYGGFTGSPTQSLSALLGALGGANMGQQTSTQTQQPGLFNYLSLGLGALSDIRLKDDIKPAGEIGGVRFYTWNWNETGKRLADPKQPTFGVIADEVAVSHPQHVARGADGYLRVNYAGLIGELRAA